jgi:autophagy-related protein 101
MANRFEHVLPELVLQEQHVSDALRCVLHTILFARAAGPIKPRDAHCPSLGIDYACAGSDITWSDDSVANVDGQVDASIRELRRRMSPAGGDSWRGSIAVQFYEARVTQRAFGLFKSTDKLVWEQWVVPVLMTRSLSSGGSARHALRGGTRSGQGGGGEGRTGAGGGAEGAAAQAAQAAQRQHMAQERAVQTTANAVRECLLWVLDAARQIEHVPPVNYSFQLGETDARGGGGGQAGSGGRHGGERPEALATRVLQTPGMFDK